MKQSTSRKRATLPLIMQWREPLQPLPKRVFRCLRKKSGHSFPWQANGSKNGGGEQPFDFCAAMRQLMMDIAVRCPDFTHVQVPRILITATQARSGHAYGLQARVTPLRFSEGGFTRMRRGVTYHLQRYFLDDQEFLYVMTFCLPRFLNQSFDQKMITVFHELYHLHPEFNGDLRRHAGRYRFHTHCQRSYDRGMVDHARTYLASRPDSELLEFLRLDFAQLQARHGAVMAIIVPRPKIIPLMGNRACAAKITT